MANLVFWLAYSFDWDSIFVAFIGVLLVLFGISIFRDGMAWHVHCSEWSLSCSLWKKVRQRCWWGWWQIIAMKMLCFAKIWFCQCCLKVSVFFSWTVLIKSTALTEMNRHVRDSKGRQCRIEKLWNHSNWFYFWFWFKAESFPILLWLIELSFTFQQANCDQF